MAEQTKIDGDDLLRSMIMSGGYVPSVEDVQQMPWTKAAYNDYLSERSQGRYGTQCGGCGADDSHYLDCRFR